MSPSWLTPAVMLLATALGSFFAHRIITPKDSERAELLKEIATGAAALVVSLNPGKAWAALLELIVQQIASAPGVPTANQQAIQRAAAEALTKIIGVAPNATK
jgi:signal transduction histidine kinase